MSIELESVKYFPAEFLETPDGAPSTAAQMNMPTWTGMLTVIVWFCGVMGTIGVLGGLYQVYSVYSIAASAELIDHYYTGEEALAAQASIESQLNYLPLLYLVAGMRIVIGALFLGAVAAINTGKEQANVFLGLVCVGAILYNLTIMLATYLTLPSFESYGMDASMASAATMMIMFIAGIALTIKLVLHGGIIAYMLNRNCTELFGPKEAEMTAIDVMVMQQQAALMQDEQVEEFGQPTEETTDQPVGV